MLEKFLTKVAQKANPGRDVTVEKIGKRLFLHTHDSVGANNYLLEGTYTYDEVIALNEITTYHCGFGFCKEIGPVAFIGICNSVHCSRSGYFEYKVHEYGTSKDDSEYYFDLYSEDEAKKISNYTVYGFMGVEEVAKEATIAKVNYSSDSRYKCKRDMLENSYADSLDVIEMDCKLLGLYNFYAARILATGTVWDKKWFTGEEHPIQFGVVGDDKYVGIINLWNIENIVWFRDVWEYGCDEPEKEKIRFLSKEEAKEIKNFSLYIYLYPYSLTTKDYPIEKMDRTFDKRFNFHLSNGQDYRLI